MTKGAAYKARRRDHDFAESWDISLRIAYDELLGVAMRRAIGYHEPVYNHRGEKIGERYVYSDRLLIFLLRLLRPETFGTERQRQRAAEGRQPTVLDLMRGLERA